jgi:ABC-type Mn2+/Zn2+ transport system ATPase subunit
VHVLLSLSGGFLITAAKIPNWLIWFFWFSPFSWAVRGLSQNEFHTARYDGPTTDGSSGTLGDEYLRVYEMDIRRELWWGAIVYMIGLYLILSALSTVALHYARAWPSRGTKRNQDAEALQEEERLFAEAAAAAVAGVKGTTITTTSSMHSPPPPISKVHEVRLGSGLSSMSLPVQRQDTELSFTPINLAFKDLCYFVPIEVEDPATGKKNVVERQLLRSINGFARAGELTALMGSSGAGKTTLMDVIAGRKTSGRITGDILVNGHPQQFPAFRRRAGYAEQMDNHVGSQTVEESIAFSAALRLPRHVSAEARATFVREILDDLELTAIAHRQVGDINIPGLSPSELKRVSLGVEIAANPQVLFLDEPSQNKRSDDTQGGTFFASFNSPAPFLRRLPSDLWGSGRYGDCVVLFRSFSLFSFRSRFSCRAHCDACHSQDCKSRTSRRMHQSV